MAPKRPRPSFGPDDRPGRRDLPRTQPDRDRPKPPTLTLQPSSPKTGKSNKALADKWYRDHPGMSQWRPLINRWAPEYGVDPLHLAALIWLESVSPARAQKKDPRTIVSPADAVGLAQIHGPTWFGKKGPGEEVVTREKAENPSFAIRFAAWYLSQGLSEHGTYEDAYRHRYNPGYRGPDPFRDIPEAYVPAKGKLPPAEAASAGFERTQEREELEARLTDPWVVVKDGKVGYSYSAQPPKRVARGFGLPIRKSAFLEAKTELDDIFLSYSGRRSKPLEAAAILSKGLSRYSIQKLLSKLPSFTRSPLWQANAPAYLDIAETTLGPEVVKRHSYTELVRQAILHSWQPATFQAKLRDRPEYLESTEFKTNEAALAEVYRRIYGHPDENAKNFLREATLGQWTDVQLQSFLRSLPEWYQSPEYRLGQAKEMESFARAVGVSGVGIQAPTGPVPTERPPGYPTPGALPDDPRVQGLASPPVPFGGQRVTQPQDLAPAPKPKAPRPPAKKKPKKKVRY